MQPQAAVGDGGLTVVDDDLLPSHATGARGAWAAGAPNYAAAAHQATQNPFPVLPPPGQARQPIDAPRPPPRPQATPMAVDPAMEAAQAAEAEARAARRGVQPQPE